MLRIIYYVGEIIRKYGCSCVSQIVKAQSVRWLCHVFRISENGHARKILMESEGENTSRARSKEK